MEQKSAKLSIAICDGLNYINDIKIAMTISLQSANYHYFVLESRASSFLLSYDCTTVQKRLGPSTNILSNDSTGQESVIQVCTD